MNEPTEPRVIRAPSGELRVTDHGGFRRIQVMGQAVRFAMLRAVPAPVETPLTLESIEYLVAFRGDYWLDELTRRQDPTYVSRGMQTLIKRFGTFRDARVLELGSGCGSSGLVMLDAGAATVQGIEPDPRCVKLARLCARDEHVEDRITFTQLDDTSHLPFDDGQFDMVTFSAVVEHIPPALRADILREAWRCLRPGGLLVITETPNRAFPYDGHTTGLPLLPWLPLALAYPMARRFSRHVARGSSLELFIAQGLVGVTYWELCRALPDALCLNRGGGDARWKCDLKATGPFLRALLAVAEGALNRLGIPLVAIMPRLDLVFQRPPVS